MIKKQNVLMEEELWAWLKSRAVLRHLTISEYITKLAEGLRAKTDTETEKGLGQIATPVKEEITPLKTGKEVKAFLKGIKLEGQCVHNITKGGICRACPGGIAK